MKVLLAPVILICCVSLANAQNSVIINQQGSGNKVTINQSAGNSKAAKSKNDCNQMFKNLNANSNKVLVRRANGASDTLVNVAGVQRNVVKKQLGKQELVASQYGTANGLYLALPDSQKSYKKFKSTQKGSRNQVTAHLNNTIHDVTILQSGNKNNIAINPCTEQKAPAKHEESSVTITQKGKGNTSIVVQN